MSADNGYVVRKDNEDKFVLSQYFASEQDYPEIRETDQRFDTLEELVLEYSQRCFDKYWSEYGLSFSLGV